MDLLNIEKEIKSIEGSYHVATKAYEEEVKIFQRELKELIRLKAMLLKSYDMNKIILAEKTLKFSKGFKRYDMEPIVDAINDIVSGKNELRTMYFGNKDYAHWSNQSVKCSYGMGPRHGNVVFSVGLYVTNRELTDEEKNACLYYLKMLIKDKSFREYTK